MPWTRGGMMPFIVASSFFVPSIGEQFGPVLIGLFDEARNVGQPELLHFLVVVEIELAVDDPPRLRIDLDGMSVAYAVGAVAAVLGGVRLGALHERLAMRSRGEAPLRVHPFILEIYAALDRL